MLVRTETFRKAQAAVAGDAHGLIDFIRPNAERHYTIPHVVALDLSAGSWAIGVWSKIDDNSGDFFQYVVSNGPFEGTGTVNLYSGDDNTASPGQVAEWIASIVDDTGTGTGSPLSSSGDQAVGGVERLVVIQDDGSNTELYLTPKDGTASQADTDTTLGNITPADDWHFGCRADLNTDRFYEEHAGGLFFVNRAMTTTEMESIATGQSPVTVLGAACVAFWPFKDGAVAVETDVVNSIDATRQGTGW